MKKVKSKIYLVLDNIRSLYNVGSIFRLADAAAVAEIYLCGISGVEKIGDKVWLNPKLKKSALSGFDSVKWRYFETTEEAIQELKSKRVKVVVVELTDKSKNYLEVSYSQPLALVVGHETDGIDDEIIKVADEVVEIPMLGKGTSLNVSLSLTIVLYEVLRQLNSRV